MGGENTMNMGDKIKYRRKQLKITADQLGDMIGKNRATIYRYEKNEIEDMPYTIVTKLSKALNLSPSYLMGWDEQDAYQTASEYDYIPIPVSAGEPITIDGIIEKETITIPDDLLGRYAGDSEIFFMRVNGDSMNKIIPHKSLIAVKPINITELDNNDIIVYSNGYSFSVKRFYRDGERLIFRPESYDTSFTDYIVSEAYDDLRLHGKVVTYIVNLD